MKNVKRMLTGIAFTLVLALSLTAMSGEADAKSRGGNNRPVTAETTSSTSPAPAGALNALGVTWE